VEEDGPPQDVGPAVIADKAGFKPAPGGILVLGDFALLPCAVPDGLRPPVATMPEPPEARPGDRFELRGPIGGYFAWSVTARRHLLLVATQNARPPYVIDALLRGVLLLLRGLCSSLRRSTLGGYRGHKASEADATKTARGPSEGPRPKAPGRSAIQRAEAGKGQEK
jgi:hypothetical protein